MDRTDPRLAHSLEQASDDVASPSNPRPPAGSARPSPGDPPPWECDPPEPMGRQRHDAFTGAKKQIYLKALVKTGCIVDACRLTGVSSSTVYNHQAGDPDFARNCQLAVAMAATPIELTAYERAVVGQEEDVIRGGKVVGTRIKRSDYMLRVLLQGADPKKYGPRPGFTRKRLLKAERKQIEREVRARLAEHRPPIERVTEQIVERVENIKRLRERQRRAEGWTELGCGLWIPPGWVWAGEGDPSEAVAELQKKDDAVCNSSSSSTSQGADEEAVCNSATPQPANPRAPTPSFPRKREPMNTEARESDPPSSWIPDQVRDDAEDNTPTPSFPRKRESTNTEAREPDPPSSWIPDQVRDDTEDATPTPSFPRKREPETTEGQSTNTEAREPDPPCSWIPDQVRDDAEAIAPTPSFPRKRESTNTEAREPDPPSSWIPDQVRDDAEDPTPTPSFPRKREPETTEGQSTNTEARKPDPPRPGARDQVRDDENESPAPTSKPPRPGILAVEPPGEPK